MSDPDNSNQYVGTAKIEERNQKIINYWNKKSNRNSHKKVRYGCR